MSDYDDNCFALGVAVMSNTPTILWSGPGEGKTSVINALAMLTRLPIETIIASIREPSDFAGLPVVDAATGSVRLAPPQWAKNLADAGKGIAFYDEISTAPPATQAALLRPILDGWVGECKLPDEVRTLAAANPADIAAGGWELAPPMANRFLHLQWKLPADVVRDGFTVGWPEITLPNPDEATVEARVTEAKVLVGSFLGTRPELLSVLPTDSTGGNMAFPTPRSWEQAAKLYGWAMACGAGSNVVKKLMLGSVGLAATTEFLTFVRDLDLPDPDRLLADPDSFVVPRDRGDKVYAITASVFTAMSNNLTKERWENAGRIFGMVAAAEYADIAYNYGVRWARSKPEGVGAMPTPDTTQRLLPILGELGRLIQTG